MRLAKFLFAALLLSGAGKAHSEALQPETHRLDVKAPWGGETTRAFHALTPPNTAPGERLPAVFILHDAGDPALAAVYRHGWLATASQAHFAIIAPEAGLQRKPDEAREGGFFNARVWNAGGEGAAAWDDIAFLSDVARDAARRYRLDGNRLYLVGFGAGGSMAQTVLAAGDGPYAAMASVAGTLHGRPAAPGQRPLLLLYGLADPTNPVGGGKIYLPWTGPVIRPKLVDQANAWRQALTCAGQAETTGGAGVDARWSWRHCGGPAKLDVIWAKDLGRQWPGTGAGPLPQRVTGPSNDAIFAPWEIWRFVEAVRHPSPNGGLPE